MKRFAICSLFLFLLAAFGSPVLAADSGDQATTADLLQVENLQSTDEAPSVSSLAVNECTAGNGATCSCEGTCQADGDSCSCN